MKRTLELALASGLALMIAGCSSGSSSSSSGASADSSGQPASGSLASRVEPVRFNLAVRCPGVHYLVTKGKSKDEIMGQLQVTDDQIQECEKYVASQPKGFVPPPPPGYVAPAQNAQAGGSGGGSAGAGAKTEAKAGAKTEAKAGAKTEAKAAGSANTPDQKKKQ